MKHMRLLPVLMIAMLLLGARMPTAAHAEGLSYWIGVDIANQCTTIYSAADNSVVHRWACSTGKSSGSTPTGAFYLPKKKYSSERMEWYYFPKYRCWGKYATRIQGPILFHSVPFTKKDDSCIDQEAVAMLGKRTSHGCIRLSVSAAQWIANHCPAGTKTIIHNGVSDSRIVAALGGNAGTGLTPELQLEPEVRSLSLSPSGTVTVNKGEVLQLNCAITPQDAKTRLTWKSSRSAVATVDGSGLVSAKAEGTANVSVAAANGQQTAVTVKVIDPYKPTGIQLNYTGPVVLNKGDALQLNATLSPATAQSNLMWSTTSRKRAPVDENGVVTGAAEGTATITVRTNNGKKATVKVQVVDPLKAVSVKLDHAGTVVLNKGETLQLNATLSPATAQSNLTWSTTSRKRAPVDENGVVTGAAEGTATITVRTNNGKKATVKVQVVDPLKAVSVKLDHTGTVVLNKGEALQLSATLSPATAKSDLTWTTSNRRCATVGADGTVKGVARGTATITVRTSNGKKARVKVKVPD